jgi:hypothetical protein
LNNEFSEHYLLIVIITATAAATHSSLLKFIMVLYLAFLLWKLLSFGSLFDISKTFLGSKSVRLVKIAPLLDALQLLMLFVGT